MPRQALSEAPPGSVILEIEHVTKRYGARIAVDDVSLRVSAGECLGFLGPNGAGKSTLLAAAAGIVRPDAGSIRIGNRDIWRSPREAKRLIGFVPQDVALYPTLTARENLAFWGSLAGIGDARTLRKRIAEVLELVGLEERDRDRVRNLSGGMKRRLNIAAALLHQPSLLFLDEPTVGIDPQSRRHILDTVRSLVRDKGLTVVYTSHYMEEVEDLCTRVAIVDRGKVLVVGTLDDVKRLAGEHETVELEVRGDARAARALLANHPAVLAVAEAIAETAAGGGGETGDADTLLVLRVERADHALPEILAALTSQLGGRVTLRALRVRRPDLETAFLALTGRTLRT
ncbi:MAG: ABC transporter, ATP-binding protein [Brockia lithotrophica]|uniref:ABC transporter, ATP-binding protein n=1 Tax=Brockia lithotrophica TaxID=933949 RepID=A0A2T5G763_9BACL|nr:MAG: ABC transporter, ATP-binding protein [Brockia lithotrophica]